MEECIMKRLLDIVFSVIALVMLSPLLILVAVILRCTGEGYVLYRQERVGKGGRPFGLYKFATMLKDSPRMAGGLLTTQNDPRILPFGRILRATKINEIPQLLNVLLGDMSLIGPRPQAKAHFDVFSAHVKQEILKVRPGLSGAGSIVFHDESAILAQCGQDEHVFYAEDIAPYKGQIEVWYVQHQSLWLDGLLILLTLWVVLFPKSRLHLRLLRDLPALESRVLADCLGVPVPPGRLVLRVSRPSVTERIAMEEAGRVQPYRQHGRDIGRRKAAFTPQKWSEISGVAPSKSGSGD
jgi:lipopolysaccharide/colanic/teichoic acid biosynthesis glycosyltransferase